ncbi:endo alpha-1,4 polygalactosaminidase [Candidatus Bipolaricaulota bacterium]|jgi:cysteinyl-tRNA synthetase|nr:endo alpha-1,4 polygalactosaminidase [Candidatus Bipolaricaulota bacterium]TFH10677.1 MAG: hypothetical protein E4H08_03080 [Candidatus Atribacteria bacterium]
MSRGRGMSRGGLCLLTSLAWCLVGCTYLLGDIDTPPSPSDAMRELVSDIAAYARSVDNQFIVIAQNGDELLTTGDTASAPLANDYVSAIDGLGREDLFYGYDEDNEVTPVESTEWMLSYLDRAEDVGIEVLVIDYCWGHTRMDDSMARNAMHGFVSFAALDRMLDVIPEYPAHPANESADDIHSLSHVGNFLYLINPWRFRSKQAFVDALAQTTYDALILDLEFKGDILMAEEVDVLKRKANGGSRLVLCYLSIGEAEDYRSYWDLAWFVNPPSWLQEENPDWEGNFPVAFWHPAWREIVFAMLDQVLAAGFNGVYLDRVDVYEEFED